MAAHSHRLNTWRNEVHSSSDHAQRHPDPATSSSTPRSQSSTRTTISEDASLLPDAGESSVALERGSDAALVFAPHTTTVYDLALVTPTDPVEQRPDLGGLRRRQLVHANGDPKAVGSDLKQPLAVLAPEQPVLGLFNTGLAGAAVLEEPDNATGH